jgi:hypothetical protein
MCYIFTQNTLTNHTYYRSSGASGKPGCQVYSVRTSGAGLDSTLVFGDWDVETYRVNNAVASSSNSSATTYDLSQVTFVVRSSADPWVKANAITQGSLDFGLTPGNKRRLGIALIVVGVFLVLPMIAILIWLKGRNKSKKSSPAIASANNPQISDAQAFAAVSPQPNYKYY